MAGTGPVSPAMLAIMTMILPLQITSMMASYSAQAMIGVIIYDTAFKKADLLTLIEQFSQSLC